MREVYKFIFALSVTAGLIVSPLFVLDANAFGLEVDPAEINLRNVPLGKTVVISALSEEKMKLRIQNKSAIAYTYVIDTLPFSKTAGILKNGYTGIPDTSWIWPQEKEVLIPGNSVKEVELFLKVPNEEEYKGKGFLAVIEVKSKKNSPEDVFVLAVQLKVSFSTQPAVKGIDLDDPR